MASHAEHANREVLLSPEQVARLCGLSRRAVYRAVARGDLAAARLCNRLRIRPADLDRWISESVERPPWPSCGGSLTRPRRCAVACAPCSTTLASTDLGVREHRADRA